MIKRIKLRNFKSFKRAEIEFRDNFTVITGPNGSGKSNVIDAILFCMGVTSSKTLRADRLTDLIRNDKNEAEVTIEIDGYEIRRRIKKTEKGYYSYYYINGKSVSYSEVERLIESLGLKADYNVIMQGDVTRIAEMTPIQRRKIIEDVAGISEFEEKKEKALEELESVKRDIEKVDVVVKEVEDQLSKLRVEKEEALRYRNLLEEKRRLEYYKKVHILMSLLEKIGSVESERDEVLKRIAEINLELVKLNEEVENLSNKITSFKDEELKKINDEINSITSEIASLKRTIDIYSKEVNELRNERERILIAIQKTSDEIEDIENKMKDIEARKESLEMILKEKIDQLKILKDNYDRLSLNQGKLRRELDEKLKILSELKERRTTILKEREKVLEGLRRIEMEIEDIELSKKEMRLRDLFDEIARCEKELILVKNEIDKVRLKMFEVDGEIFRVRDEISKVSDELKKTEIELAKILAQKPKAVEIILKAKEEGKLDGIHGTVSQLCNVDDRFALALEVAGGNALNFIVVDNEDVAIRAVRYLKEVNGGRASFIPLNRVKVNLNLDRSIFVDGVIDYAVNLIECDEKFRPVFELIYKDTLVVRDIDVAKRFINRFRVVTLEGDLIEKSGIITGGSIKRHGIFDKKLREKMMDLKERKERLEFELTNLEDLRKDLQNKLDVLNENAMRLRESINVNRSKVEEIKLFLTDVERKLKEKRKEYEILNERAVDIEEELSEVEKEIATVEGEIDRLKVEIKDEEVSKLRSKIDALRAEIERLKDLVSTVNSERSSLHERREQKVGLLSEYRERLKCLDEKIEDRLKEIKRSNLRIDELRSKLDELKKIEREINEEVFELRRKRDDLMAKIESLEKEKNRCLVNERILEEKLKDLRCKLEDVKKELNGKEIPKDLPPIEYVKRRLVEIEEEIKSFGDVNMKAIQDYERVEERYRDLVKKKEVLERERRKILEKIRSIEEMKKSAFMSTFNAINENFKEIVRELADGEGEIYLDREDPFSSGLHIKFKPFGKHIQRIESMSGGEKSLLTLAFIFAIQRFKPAPFYAFDEVDMFLDGVNVGRLAKMIKRLSSNAQFIVVSLRKPMLEESDHVVGITRGGDGESIVTAIQLR